MPQDLKLRCTLDSTDVGTGAKSAVGSLNAIEAASKRASAEIRRLQAEQDDIASALTGSNSGALPRAIDSAQGASRIRLGTTTAAETEKTAVQMAKIKNLGSIFANTGVGPYVLQLKAVLEGMQAVAAAATVGSSLAVAGIALAAAPIAYVVAQVSRLRSLQRETAAAALGDNTKDLGRISGQIGGAIESGTLRGDAAKEFARRIAELEAENARGSRLKSVAGRSASAGAVSAGIGSILRDLRAELQQSYAGEEEAATKHAAALAEIQRIQLQTEEAQLKQRYDRGLITAEDYYAKLTLLQGRQTYTFKQTLDVEEKALRDRLARQQNDAAAAAETRARIAAIGDERAVLDARANATASANSRAAQSISGPAFRSQSVAVDDLARIGLFRGGTGDSQVSLLKQQVDLLKDANRTLALNLEATRAL